MLPGFAPAVEAILFRQKGERTDASLKRAAQLARLKQGPPAEESVPPLGQTAGVGAEAMTNQPYGNQRYRKREPILERIQEEALKKNKPYHPDPIESLRDTAEAEEYLNAALEEGDPELFLLALRNVAEAQGGVAQLAEKAKLNRESLYKILSERGNPELKSLDALLHALGFRLAVTANR